MRVFCPNILRLLSEWTETFPYDFRDERMMDFVRTLTQSCVAVDNKLRTTVQRILQGLLDKLSNLEQYEHLLHTIEDEMKPLELQDNSKDKDIQVTPHTYSLSSEIARFCYVT